MVTRAEVGAASAEDPFEKPGSEDERGRGPDGNEWLGEGVLTMEDTGAGSSSEKKQPRAKADRRVPGLRWEGMRSSAEGENVHTVKRDDHCLWTGRKEVKV